MLEIWIHVTVAVTKEDAIGYKFMAYTRSEKKDVSRRKSLPVVIRLQRG